MRANRAKFFPSLALLAAALGSGPVFAGGWLETYDITANVPSPIPGQITARLIRIFHDPRCIPFQFRVNNTLDPVPNPLGPPFVSLADATTVFQKSLATWTQIPTSYIDMRVTGTVANPGFRGFDMRNEVTFRSPASFGAIAASLATSLINDTTLQDGDDIDGDGVSDVSSAITTCTVDPAGHVTFPAGFYKAGTILDVDVQLNTKTSNGLRFTVADADVDTNTRSVDLQATVTHEFGHSLGLSHVLNNQISATKGTGATMFPFIDTGDPAAEFGQRKLSEDDIAWASYFYPEGTAATGPAALQPGDIPFNLVYGLIKGSVTHGVLNEPVAGASVSATNLVTGELFSTAFSGTSQVSYNPATGGLSVISPAYDILDGNFTLPVKLGLYKIGVEAVDGLPVPAGSISVNAQIGAIFGQQNFNEEFWNPGDSAIEVQPGFGFPVAGIPNFTLNGINIVTNDQVNVNNFGSRDFVGFTGSAPGTYYAVRVPASQISAINPGGKLYIQEAAYDTFVFDASVVPIFAEADLVTGTVDASGATATLDLAHPLAKVTNFVGQDNDFAPFYFPFPDLLGRLVQQGIASGQIQNLFMVLRVPTTAPYPGVSALPPSIGLDGGNATNDVPLYGLSYLSTDGVTFNQVNNFNFRFSLIVTKAP
ncbi:MAG TPA: matrixin family metalloprotease [Thermoanaerobaculia bacterium]